MKTKGQNTDQSVQISEAELLSLVAAKLKDRVLFPESVEEAKKLFTKIKYSEL